MLRKIMFVLMILLVIAAASGCSKVSDVKDSYWSGDDRITIGKALDKYAYFEKTDWKYTTTDNGIKYVDFTGIVSAKQYDKIDDKLNKTRQKYPNIDSEIKNKQLRDVYHFLMYSNNPLVVGYDKDKAIETIEYMTNTTIKDIIKNNNRIELNIRFRYEKSKDKKQRANIEYIKFVNKTTRDVYIDNASSQDVLNRIYDNTPMYSTNKEKDFDVYKKVGSAKVGSQIGDDIKKELSK